MIQIIRNEAGNCVTFQGSSNPVYWNSCLSGEVDYLDASLINIKNDIRTASESEIVYEFYNIPYTDFLDSSGNGFANALECAEYITAECNVLGSIGEQVASDSDAFDFSLDAKDNTVLMSTGDYFPVNTIQATLNDGKLDVNSITGSKVYYSNINPNNLSMNSSLMTGTSESKVNTLNALFQNTGTASSSVPSITSSLAVSMTQGSSLNYELTATNGVAYEWDLSNVSGIATVDGQPRKLIGGSSLASAVYNIPVKAINYNGEDSKILVLTIDAPLFSNYKSLNFEQNDYLSGAVSEVNNIFGRASNGDGKSWTISTYFKAGSHNNSVQTIMFAGGNNADSNPSVLLYWDGNHPGRQSIALRYGSSYNFIKKVTPKNTVSNDGAWHHIMVTFNGGTTGNQSGQISQYYSRFKIFLDGIEQNCTNSHAAFGNASAFNVQLFRAGRWGSSGSYLRDSCRVDELAFWDTDKSADISDIYNGGVPFNLTSQSPKNWWRMGDEDTYPTILDNAGNTDLTMNSMTAASIVNDAP